MASDKPKIVLVVRPKRENSEKLSISLPAALIEWLDSKVQETGSDRSKVIRAALEMAQKQEVSYVQAT